MSAFILNLGLADGLLMVERTSRLCVRNWGGMRTLALQSFVWQRALVGGCQMGNLNARNLTLIALIVSCFLQVGGGLFAISVVVSTLMEAPPRSFAMLEGEYRYDSSAFWETLPPINAVLFVIALAANWKTTRRVLLVAAFALFILGGLLAGFLLEPELAAITEVGYRDVVDPDLQSRAASWYAIDWAVWSVTLLAGLFLLLALAHPVTSRNKKQGGPTV